MSFLSNIYSFFEKGGPGNNGESSQSSVQEGGSAHKGESSHSEEPRMMAFKRLHHEYGQEDPKFWKQIMMLACYRHENLISLLGFCNMKKEKILVYDYASNKSLDLYLSNTSLSWTRRLKICVGAARGLNYLHDPEDTKRRVVHGDMKSSNIILDENWTAKVSDFGLQTFIALGGDVGKTSPSDPKLTNVNRPTSEADVYAFGVVLIEVLCGRAKKNLVVLWQDRYKKNKLDAIIIHELRLQMGEECLHKFASIANKCLQKKRPTMAEVVKELEDALKLQEFYEDEEKKMEEEELKKIGRRATNLQFHGSQEKLLMLLSKGILLAKDETWFSLDNNMEHCEMISAAHCFQSDRIEYKEDPRYIFQKNVLVRKNATITSAHIGFQFLTPHITYGVYVVFKFLGEEKTSLTDGHGLFKCSINGDQLLACNLPDERKGGWLMTELCQFSSRTKKHDISHFKLEVSFKGNPYLIEGLECQPLEKGKLEEWQDLLDTYSDQQLPSDYLKKLRSKYNVKDKSEEDLYLLLRKGFNEYNPQDKWLFIDQNGKKCHVIGALKALKHVEWEWISSKRLKPFVQAGNLYHRFDMVAKILPGRTRVRIECEYVQSVLLSPQTKYVAYLVFKLITKYSMFRDPVKVNHKHLRYDRWEIDDDINIIFLVSPQTSVISQLVGQKDHNPLNRPKMNGIPKQRKDGWMEVKLWVFQSETTREFISMGADLSTFGYNTLPDLLVQGIELRPL